jgi:hypothetical protein
MGRHNDDETHEERQAREREEARKYYELTGVIAVAGEVNQNGICYSKEALQGAVDRYNRDGHPAYGVVFDPQKPVTQVHVADIAFQVSGMEFDGIKLKSTIKTLPTPQGEMVDRMLELEVKEPGSFALAMGGIVDEDGIEELEDGTKVIRSFRCERISILPAKEKA